MRVRDETHKIVQVEGEIIGVGMEKKAIAQILSMATLKTSMLRLTLIRHAVIMGCSTLPRHLTVYQASWHARPPLLSLLPGSPVPSCNTLEALLKHNQRGRLPRAFAASHKFSQVLTRALPRTGTVAWQETHGSPSLRQQASPLTSASPLMAGYARQCTLAVLGSECFPHLRHQSTQARPCPNAAQSPKSRPNIRALRPGTRGRELGYATYVPYASPVGVL
jgi:hypothetical protein